MSSVKVLIPGNRVLLPVLNPVETLELIVDLEVGDTVVEMTCVGLNQRGHALDGYAVSLRRPVSTQGAVQWLKPSLQHPFGFRTLQLRLHALPKSVHQLLLVISIMGVGFLDEWGKGRIQVNVGNQAWQWAFHGSKLGAFSTLKAVLLHRVEDEGWALRIEGQGFKGSLAALMEHLMEPEADEIIPAPVPASVAEAARNDANVRLKKVRLMASHLLEWYQSAQKVLDRFNDCSMYSPRLVLVIDHTVAMAPLYVSGQVQILLDQLMGLSAHWNSAGDIDVFLAGQHTISLGAVEWRNSSNAPKKWMLSHPFEQRVQYGRVMEMVRQVVYPVNKGGETRQLCGGERPVYVLWIVTHDADDAPMAQWQLRWASREPIFWQFMAVTGHRGRLKSARVLNRQGGIGGDFRFLDNLQGLNDRALTNTDYFTVSTLGDYTLDELYEAMLDRYAVWLGEVEQKGMVRKT